MKTLIATLCAGGQAYQPYIMSLTVQAMLAKQRMAHQEHYDLGFELVMGDSGLAKDRCLIASRALFEGWEKLVLIDADQSWTWPQLKKLLDSPHPITAGVVALKRYPIQMNFTPMVHDRETLQDERGIIRHDGLDRLEAKYGGRTDIEVQAAGTGFMCIDREVLLKMAEHPAIEPFFHNDPRTNLGFALNFFQTGVVVTDKDQWFGTKSVDITIPRTNIKKRVGVYFGEDWGFCALASQCGFKIHIDTAIRIPHWGLHEYRIGQKLTEDIYGVRSEAENRGAVQEFRAESERTGETRADHRSL